MTAHQAGHTIFETSISFVAPEEGVSHQEPMPEAPNPEDCRPWWETIALPRMGQAELPPRRREEIFTAPDPNSFPERKFLGG
mgnify:CR=1 FL=1